MSLPPACLLCCCLRRPPASFAASSVAPSPQASLRRPHTSAPLPFHLLALLLFQSTRPLPWHPPSGCALHTVASAMASISASSIAPSRDRQPPLASTTSSAPLPARPLLVWGTWLPGAPPLRLKNHSGLGKNSIFLFFLCVGHRKYWAEMSFLPL